MKDIKLAWRNIWRNKRRTLITVASIFFGVLLSTMMTSMQEGTYAKMIDNVVGMYTGYLQVHHHEYWESKSIDHLFTPEHELLQTIRSTKKVELVIPRLESFALMSFGVATKGGLVIGIDPQKENEMTKLRHWVKTGRYLNGKDDGILLAVNLAKNLNVSVGDTLALISQGYHGMSASGLFPVAGILEFPVPAMNNIGAYITINRAQEFFSAPEMLTSLAIKVSDHDDVKMVQHTINRELADGLSVMSWDEMDPVTKQMVESDRGQGIVMKGILFVLIGFGILSTMIMMIAERRKELGVMVAVGMKKVKLARLVFFETLWIALIGLVAGFVASVPFILAMVSNPIPVTGEMAEVYINFGMEPAMFFSADFNVFWKQILIVLFISLIVAIYPVVKVLRLNVTRSLHG